MNIAINGNEANVASPVGSNIFANELIWSIYRLDHNNSYTVLLKNKPLSILPPARTNWHYQVIGPRPFWTQFSLPFYLSKHKFNLLFSPGHYGAAWGKTPQIIAVMDLAYEKFAAEFKSKDLWQLRFWTKRSVGLASKIIAISQNTKNDLIDIYQVNSDKIKVIYPALPTLANKSVGEHRQTAELIKHLITTKYILFVSTLQPRKNIVKLISAFAKLIPSNPDLNLVIVGKKGWLFQDIFRQVKALNLSKKVIFTGFITHKAKERLYQHAQCLVMPSLYEGFGFPLLEAFAYSCPVVCSRNSSLPEVAGSCAIYIQNPDKVNAIADSVRKMLKLSLSQRNKLIREGKKQLKQFSWEIAGKKVIKLFNQLN